jgi:hypothetical protein
MKTIKAFGTLATITALSIGMLAFVPAGTASAQVPPPPAAVAAPVPVPIAAPGYGGYGYGGYYGGFRNLGDLFVLDRLFAGPNGNGLTGPIYSTSLGDLLILDQLFGNGFGGWGW